MSELTTAGPIETPEDEDILPIRKAGAIGLLKISLLQTAAYVTAKVFGSLEGKGGQFLRVKANAPEFEFTADIGDVDEAPADGRLYGRQSDKWVPITSIAIGDNNTADPDIGVPEPGAPATPSPLPTPVPTPPPPGNGPDPDYVGTAPSAGAHKFWRVRPNLTTGPANQAFVAINTLEFRESIGGPNAAVDGSPIEWIGGHFGDRVPANAFDGDPASVWESNGGGFVTDFTRWIGYEFVEPVAVRQVLIRSTTFSGERPVSGVIEYSDDGLTWLLAWTFGPFDYATPDQLTMGSIATIGLGGPALYWRLRPIARHAFSRPAMQEIEFWGGGAKLSTGGTPIASTEDISLGGTAAKAFDGDRDTLAGGWVCASDDSGPWIGYKFPKATLPTTVKLWPSARPEYVDDGEWGFNVESSNDGEEWEIRWYGENMSPPWATGELRQFGFGSAATGGGVLKGGASKFRIITEGTSGAVPSGWGEIVLMGEGGAVIALSAAKNASDTEGDNTAAKAFDNLPTTAWLAPAADAVGSYIEFGSADIAFPTFVRLRPRSDNYASAPVSFRFQYHDGTDWVDAGSHTFNWSSSVPRNFAITVPGSSEIISGDEPEEGEDVVTPVPTASTRIRIRTTDGSSGTGWAEVAFLGADGRFIPSQSAEHSASSKYSDEFAADAAWDGQPGTGWRASTDDTNPWIEAVFATAVEPKIVRLRPFVGSPETAPATFDLEYWTGEEFISGMHCAHAWTDDIPRNFRINIENGDGQVVDPYVPPPTPPAPGTVPGDFVDAPADDVPRIRVNQGWATLEEVGVGGSADYPDFDGNAGRLLSVTATEDGVEWIDPPEGGLGGSVSRAPQSSTFPLAVNAVGFVPSFSATEKGLTFVGPASGNGVHISVALHAVPNAEWNIVAELDALSIGGSPNGGGLVVRNSANGRLMSIAFMRDVIEVNAWTSSTAFSGNRISLSSYLKSTIYFRIARVGTDIVFSISKDGVNWVVLHTEAIATFLGAAGQAGLMLHNESDRQVHLICSDYRKTGIT